MVTSYSDLTGFTAGTYYVRILPGTNTTMDVNDFAAWRIIEYP
jgi:hypothetical protein